MTGISQRRALAGSSEGTAGRSRRRRWTETRAGINVHTKPLIGAQLIRGIVLVDVEKLQAKIASGRSAAGAKRRDRGDQTKGGAGVASRTVSTLRSMLGHAKRFGLIQTNPALGVRVIAGNKKLRRLSREELGWLGAAMAMMEEQGEHPTGLATIRIMLLTGFRKMEVLGMHRAWIDVEQQSVCFPDSKTGQQVRVIGRAAVDLLLGQPKRDDLPFVFPADWGDGHFVGVVRVLDRICARAGIKDITPHVLRHTFASIAAELGFSELTIAALLGHASRGVTQRYVHLDRVVVSAANQVAAEIARFVVPRPLFSQRDAAE